MGQFHLRTRQQREEEKCLEGSGARSLEDLPSSADPSGRGADRHDSESIISESQAPSLIVSKRG